MKLTIELRWIIIPPVLLGCAVWLTIASVRGNHQREVDRLNTALYQSEQEITRYRIRVNGLEESVAEVNLIVVDKDSEILQLKEEKERLRELNIRKVSVIGSLEATVSLLKDSISVQVTDDSKPSWGAFVPDKTNPVLPLPARIPYEDEWASVLVGITTSGYASFDFNLSPLPVNIVIGEKKEGAFKKAENVAVVTTPCPYVTFDDTKMVLVDETKPKWPYVVGGGVLGAAIVVGGKILINSFTCFCGGVDSISE
jgi:hypothetical protein